ncbi:hypothetical protein NDU88_004229 [Pleurodeles waltl]|uniref:Uncharacterized protein n=1 Tax=Pleurodeles waltl TaxID=8319 RepID=A0AAV7VFP2_PLEWA|nr:hypothetical protein NDU88_004229 [Pleurodeles waltl]
MGLARSPPAGRHEQPRKQMPIMTPHAETTCHRSQQGVPMDTEARRERRQALESITALRWDEVSPTPLPDPVLSDTPEHLSDSGSESSSDHLPIITPKMADELV